MDVSNDVDGLSASLFSAPDLKEKVEWRSFRSIQTVIPKKLQSCRETLKDK
jgi:hypothetical protein